MRRNEIREIHYDRVTTGAYVYILIKTQRQQDNSWSGVKEETKGYILKEQRA